MKSVQIKLELNQPLGIGGAFGVLRLDVAFPALDLASVPLDFNGSLAKCKAEKAVSRPPHSKGYAEYNVSHFL